MGRKGFGQSQVPTRDAKKFMASFAACLKKTKGDNTKIFSFFDQNLSRLNETLLEALPLVFDDLTKGKLPEEKYKSASIFGDFGVYLYRYSRGDRSLNLELCIAAYQKAQDIFTRKKYSEGWAKTHMNLGNAYCDRIRGERADNIEQAIEFYQIALNVFSQDAFPEMWAKTHTNLGSAYLTRIRGERADNIEQAIEFYQIALNVFSQDAFPEMWAKTHMNLGSAYLTRIRGERTDNIEQAIKLYQIALQIYTQDAFPEDWAGTHMNLGSAYRARIRGERADNIEQAIKLYQIALNVYTQDAFPEMWAKTHMNLGSAYRARIQGERKNNLEQAIHSHQNAAPAFLDTGNPLLWAENQSNLAEALLQKATEFNHPEKIKQVLSLLEEALNKLPQGSTEYIDTQYRLGAALSHQYEISQSPTDLTQAITAYKNALDAISPEHYNRDKLWSALPTTQAIYGQRLIEDGSWHEGLQLLLSSAAQLQPHKNPSAYATVLHQLGIAYELLSDSDKARMYYRDALRWYEHLNSDPGIAKSCYGLGSILVMENHIEKGLDYLSRAKILYQQLNDADGIKNIDDIMNIAQNAKEYALGVYQ